jgi:hypothetical protein
VLKANLEKYLHLFYVETRHSKHFCCLLEELSSFGNCFFGSIYHWGKFYTLPGIKIEYILWLNFEDGEAQPLLKLRWAVNADRYSIYFQKLSARKIWIECKSVFTNRRPSDLARLGSYSLFVKLYEKKKFYLEELNLFNLFDLLLKG